MFKIIYCIFLIFSGGDEVQRSLELLDSVLSEFEEGGGGEGGGGGGAADEAVLLEGAGAGAGPGQGGGGGDGVARAGATGTPDDDSPSLGGHQSEDDGYMSMNGRR